MAQYNPPEGYLYDEKSGLFYTQVMTTDINGIRKQIVTWFDAESGKYSQEVYSVDGNAQAFSKAVEPGGYDARQSVQNSSPEKRLSKGVIIGIVAGGIMALGVIALGIFASMAISSNAKPKNDFKSSKKEIVKRDDRELREEKDKNTDTSSEEFNASDRLQEEQPQKEQLQENQPQEEQPYDFVDDSEYENVEEYATESVDSVVPEESSYEQSAASSSAAPQAGLPASGFYRSDDGSVTMDIMDNGVIYYNSADLVRYEGWYTYDGANSGYSDQGGIYNLHVHFNSPSGELKMELQIDTEVSGLQVFSGPGNYGSGWLWLG